MVLRFTLFCFCFLLFQCPLTLQYDIGAFYFGNWHVDPLNEQQHGTNWTEWRLLQQALPRFPGHQQPKVPAWGYQDESDPLVFQQKIDAAAANGLDYFLFDWYWHENTGPFLWRSLEQGYLKAPNNSQQVQFAIMWANHDWFDIQPAKRGWGNLLQYPGAVSRATWDQIVDHVISTYFLNKNYYKVPNIATPTQKGGGAETEEVAGTCPFFSFYELDTFVNGLGGLSQTADALNSFRQKAAANGIPCVHFNAIDWGLHNFPDPNSVITQLGISSVTSYCWIHNVNPPNFPVTDYIYMLNKSVAYWSEAAKKYIVPYIPNVSVAWDSSPRACQTDMFENVGYPYTPTFGSTPAQFQQALQAAKDYMDPVCDKSWCQLTINAWNEWTEGSYLEPDQVNGMSMLQAVKAVFG